MFHIKTIIGFFLLFQVFAFDDILYKCEWRKVCRMDDNEQGELKNVAGEKFNCYFGWTPFCVLPVPKYVTSKAEFCKSLNADSTYNDTTGFKRCEVEPVEVDEEEYFLDNFFDV